MPNPESIAVIGAGPAGLMAAEVLAQGGAAVTVYDAMASAGRKFLMAGRGGLNLTHSETLPAFLARYGKATPQLAAAIEAFPPDALARMERGAGPADLRRLQRPGVSQGDESLAACCARGCGGSMPWACNSRCATAGPAGTRRAACVSDARRTASPSMPARPCWRSAARVGRGSAPTAAWVETLAAKGVTISPLQPANCGFTVAWSDIFRDRFEGQPLKGVALSFGARSVRGEAMITRTGIEGGAIYALSAELREAVLASGRGDPAHRLAARSGLNDLTARLSAPRGKQSFSNWLRKAAQLSPVGIGLLQEAAMCVRRIVVVAVASATLAELINAVPVKLNGIAPIARAISTAGGISFDELDADFMIRRLPGVFAAGEMLDWEAPTGGYLLQASFATGAAAGRGVLKWLERQASLLIIALDWCGLPDVRCAPIATKFRGATK